MLPHALGPHADLEEEWSHTPFSDPFSIARFLRGEAEEFNRAFRMAMDYLSRHYPHSLSLQDHEDVAQEALGQSLRCLREDEDLEHGFPVWFRSVVNHRAIEHIRKQRGRERLKLIKQVETESKLPLRGRSLTVVASLRRVLHFRTFNPRGQMSRDVNEGALPEQARAIQELRKDLDGLWPPYKPTKAEARGVIAAVAAILGLYPEGGAGLEVPVDREPKPDDRAIYAETLGRLGEALRRLDGEQLKLVTMHVYEGYSLRECARLLRWSQSKAQRMWHGALDRLRAELGDSPP